MVDKGGGISKHKRKGTEESLDLQLLFLKTIM